MARPTPVISGFPAGPVHVGAAWSGVNRPSLSRQPPGQGDPDTKNKNSLQEIIREEVSKALKIQSDLFQMEMDGVKARLAVLEGRSASLQVAAAAANAPVNIGEDAVGEDSDSEELNEDYSVCALLAVSNQLSPREDGVVDTMPPESYFSYCWARLLEKHRKGESASGTIARLSLLVFVEFFFALAYCSQTNVYVSVASPHEDEAYHSCIYSGQQMIPRLFKGKPTVLYAAAAVGLLIIVLSMKSDDAEVVRTWSIRGVLASTGGMTYVYLSFLWRLRTMTIVPLVGFGSILLISQQEHIEDVIINAVAGVFLLEIDDIFFSGFVPYADRVAYEEKYNLVKKSDLKRIELAEWMLFVINGVMMAGSFTAGIWLLTGEFNVEIVIMSMVYGGGFLWCVVRGIIMHDLNGRWAVGNTILAICGRICWLFLVSLCTWIPCLGIASGTYGLIFSYDMDFYGRLERLRLCSSSGDASCEARDFMCNKTDPLA